MVLEGGDGTGTSTQLKMLQKRLSTGAYPPAYFTFEPTEGPIGTLIRQALHGSPEFLPHTIAHLFAADRHEHLYGPSGIVARCQRGELVICDRYVPSSLVYQGLACGDDTPARINSPFPYPAMILFFEVDPAVAEQRYSKREKQDMFEHVAFQQRVHQAYEHILPVYCEEGTHLIRIDAGKNIEEVAEQVWRALQNLPILKG